MEQVDFSIRGREYSVTVSSEEREMLLAAIELVDARMCELEVRTQAASETLAVMTAINVAHELIQLQRRGGLDMPGYKRRMQAMGEKIDKALEIDEALF